MLSRLFQWAYYRATGDCWSQVQRDLGIRPTLRWVLTGREVDAMRIYPTPGESFARAIREGRP
jgi:hypothetical protein